jgi:hypothetical protein
MAADGSSGAESGALAVRTASRTVVGAETAVRTESPALIASAAGARSHRPRHGLRSTATPLPGPSRASIPAHSSGAPAAAHARSVHTWSTVAGRGFTESSSSVGLLSPTCRSTYVT